MAAAAEAKLDAEQIREIEWVVGRCKAHRRKQNPFVADPHWGGGYTVGFWTANKNTSEPLWWIGDGFKNLQVARADPKEFASREEAEEAVRTLIMGEIRRWRKDQAHLIFGWA